MVKESEERGGGPFYSKDRSSSPREGPRETDNSSDYELELETTNLPDKQITNANILDIQDTSGPIESPGLDRASPLKPTDLLTTIDTVDSLQKRSYATELQTSNEISNTFFKREILKELEQTSQSLEALRQSHEKLRQNHEELRQDHEELRQGHEALENQRNEETLQLLEELAGTQRKLKELTKKYYRMQQGVNEIKVSENSALKLLAELVDKLYKNQPDLAGPLMKAIRDASHKAQVAQQQKAKAKRQNIQLQKQNVRLQQEKPQVEKQLKRVSHISQNKATGLQQGPYKPAHASPVKKREPAVISISVKQTKQTLQALRHSHEQLRKGHEELRQNHEKLKQGHEELRQDHEELRQGHEALENQRNEETLQLLEELAGTQRKLKELAETCRHMQQDVDEINFTENLALEVLTEQVDTLHENQPDPAGPLMKATRDVLHKAQVAQQQEVKANHQNIQLQQENVRLQQEKPQVEEQLSRASHISQNKATGLQQGPYSPADAPPGAATKPPVNKSESAVTTIVVKPFAETRSLRPSDLSKKLIQLIKAPTRLDRVNYSVQGNLKVRVTCPTATTEQDLSAIGEIILFNQYHTLVVDGIPSADMLNEDGSLADAENMKNAIEAQNDITLARAPRALIPRKKISEPRQFFTIAIQLADIKEYKKLMETRKLKTPFAAGRIREWAPKPSTYEPQSTSINNSYWPRFLTGFRNDQQSSNSSEPTAAVDKEPALTDADMPDAAPETSSEHHA